MNIIKNMMIIILIISIICIILNIYSLFTFRHEKFTYMNYGGYRLGSVSAINTPFMFLIKNKSERASEKDFENENCDCNYDCKRRTML